MKKYLLGFFLLGISFNSNAQKIIGALMADENGVTTDQSKAKYLVVLKKYHDSVFERLDYYFSGRRISMATYRDEEMTILNGKSAKYSTTGYLGSDGSFVNNQKEGIWYDYDDTSHAVIKYTYHLDSLLSIIDLDSLSNERKEIPEDTTDQHEAVYQGGGKKIIQIIQKNIRIPDRTQSLGKGGTAKIRFVINVAGKPTDIEVLQSMEFAFDEEAMRVIALLKDWIPASDKGRKVNAYRIQPITISLP